MVDVLALQVRPPMVDDSYSPSCVPEPAAQRINTDGKTEEALEPR